MRLLSLVVILGTFGGVAVGGGVADAQPSTAEQLHAKGLERGKVGMQTKNRAAIEEAVQLFKDALALGDAPLIECDLGLALHLLGEEARAHARLTRCMPRLSAISPEKVGRYRAVANEVEAAVAQGHAAVDVASSPPGAVISVSTFPADETVLAPTLLWLRPGTHTLTAHVDGHVDQTLTIEVTEQEAATRARKAWPVKLEPVKPAPGGGGEIVEPEQPPVVDVRPQPSRTAAHATLIGGGVLLLGGAVVHVLGRDERAHLATLSGDAYEAYKPTWHKYQRTTIGLYAAGTVVTGIGAWLYLRGNTPAPLAVSPAPEGRGAMLWLSLP